MELTLTDREKLFIKTVERIVEEWREVMHLDPIWELPVDVVEEEMPGAKGAVDISQTQYYRAPILICEDMFELDEEDFIAEVSDKIVPHELTHLVAVDFFRTALMLAKDSDDLKEELRYKYEQFVVRLCKIITTLRNENLRLRYELERASTGTEE